MTGLLIYIIRWALVLSMLYSLYGLFLKRETLHAVNRLVLLAILMAAMVLPLVQVEMRHGNVITDMREAVEAPLNSVELEILKQGNSNYSSPDATQIASADTRMSKPTGRVEPALVTIYIIGVVIAWLRYLWSLVSLLRLIRQAQPVAIANLPKGVKVVAHPDIKTPCSWLRWVLLSPEDALLPLSGEAGRGLLRHELAHIHYGHSLDMLLCELTCRMLWPVPFAWMLRQDLRDVHEFQADRRVLQSGIDENEYQLLLIRKATSTGLQPVVNALNQSPIKKRFVMMYKKPSRRWVALKAAYLLPLAALALVAFARPQTMSEIEKHVEESAPAIAEAFKNVARQLPSRLGDEEESPQQGNLESPTRDSLNSTTAEQAEEADTTAVTFADARLVAADLSESGAKMLGVPSAKSAVELLDSTMQAVGARKIAEGTYVGHFQPSLNSDTVRIADVTIRDRQSQQTDKHRFTQNATAPDAYNITLNAETRKERTGYYIRFLQPVTSTLRNYDRKEVDPKLLSTDSVLTKRGYLPGYFPIAIELNKSETRVYMYASTTHDATSSVMASLRNDAEHNFLNR